MAVWMYERGRRLKPTEASRIRIGKRCPSCDEPMLRLAMRERWHPYHWMPCGWICTACNVLYEETGV